MAIVRTPVVDGVARQQVQSYAPQPSGITQVPAGGVDQRMQWIANRANAYRQEREAAMAQQQAQLQSPNITPREYEQQGLWDKYTQNNPGGISGPADQQYREMNPLERGISFLANDVSDTVSSYSGWNPDEGFTLPNTMRFLAGLPGQLVSGFLQAPANFASGITGNQYLDNPYTQELEVDADKGVITTDQYDFAQRAASIANGFINSGMFGGTGQFIRSLTPAWKTVGSAARTVFRNAPKGVQEAISIGGATVEEGAEEGLQSGLDDITFNHLDEGSLDRAIESAKWGALGGAAFAGGARLVNKVFHNKDANQPKTDASGTDSAGQRPEASGTQNIQEQYQELRAAGGSTRDMRNANRRLNDDAIKSLVDSVPGSASVKHGWTSSHQNLDQISVSDETIETVYRRSTQPGRDKVLKAFGATKDEFEGALYNARFNNVQYENAAEALTAILKERKPHGAKVGLVRSPATRNASFFLDMTEVTHGGGIKTHSAVYTIFGADADGDTSALFFDPNDVNADGYASQMWYHPEGRNNYGESYLGIRNDVKESEIKTWIDDLFQGYSDVTDQQKHNLRMQFTKAIANAKKLDGEEKLKIQGTERDADFSHAFNQVSNQLYSSARKAGRTHDEAADIARFGVTNMLQDMSQNDISIIQETMASTHAIMEEELKSDPAEFLRKLGTLGNDVFPVDIMDYQGYVSYVLTNKGNIIFRQLGEMGYGVKQVLMFQDALDAAYKLTQDNTAMQDMIRASFRMVANSLSPTMAVEGLVDSYVVSHVLTKMGETRFRNENDYNTIMNLFIKYYDESVDMYNEAQRQYTNQGYIMPYGVIKREKINDLKNPELMKKFMRVFEATPVNMLFDTRFMGEYAQNGLTLKQLVAPIADKRNSRAAIEMYANGDKSIQEFFDKLVNGYGSSARALSRSVQGILTDDAVFAKCADAVEMYRNGTLDEMTARHVLSVCDALAQIIDPDDAFDAGVRGIDILGTRLGAMLFGRDGNARINAIIGIQLHQHYQKYIDALSSDDAEIRLGAENALLETANVNSIHRIIVEQLLENDKHESALYDFLIDTSKSWSQKQASWNTAQNIGDMFGATEDLFMDIMTTEDSEFDVSGYAVRVRKAKDSLSDAKKLLFEAQRMDVQRTMEKVYSNAHGSNQDKFVEFFKNACTRARIVLDEVTAGAKIYSAMHPSNPAMEKGTNEGSGTVSYQSLDQFKNGGSSPYLAQVCGEAFGLSNADDFANNRNMMLRAISDPKFEHEVELDDGSKIWVTRDNIMAEVDPNWKPGQEFTARSIENLLKRYPGLVDMLTEQQPNIGMLSGVAFAEPAKARTLEDTYLNYVGSTASAFYGGNHDPAVSYEVERGMHEVSNELLNFGDYTSILTAAGGKDLANARNQKEVIDIISDRHRKIVAAVYYQRQKADNGELDKNSKNAYFGKMFETSISDIGDIVNGAISFVMDGFNTDQQAQNLLRSVQEALARGFITTNVYNAINNDSDLPDISPRPTSANATSAMQGYASSMQERADRIMSVYRKAFGLMYRLSGEMFDYSGATISEADRNAMRSAIREDIASARTQEGLKGQDLLNRIAADMAKVDNIISSNATISGILDTASTEVNMVMTEADWNGGPVSIARVTSKVMRIYKYSGKMRDEVSIRREISSIFNAKPEDRASKIESYNRLCNAILYEGLFKEIRQETGARINPNAITLMHDMVDSVNAMMDHVRANTTRLDSSAGLIPERYQNNFNFPELDFWTPRIQATISQLKMVEAGAPNGTKVGVNGSYTKRMMGFGFLNPRESSNAVSNSLDVNAFMNLGNDCDSWKCTLAPEGQDLKGSDVRTVRAMKNAIRDGRITPKMIRVFDPNDNAHGINWLNMPSAPEQAIRPHSRLGSILGLLQDDAQEGMVLKAKKKFIESMNELVAAREIRNPTIYSVAGNDLRDPASAYMTLRNHLIAQRKDDAKRWAKIFKDDHKSLGLNADAALILAQGLTPAYRLHLNDGTIVLIDVEHLFHGPEDFAQAYTAIVGDRQVLKASIKYATPEEISNRICRAVVRESRGGEFPTLEEMRDIAAVAVKSWDGVVYSNKVSKVLDRQNPLGFTRRANLVADDSRTPVQYLMNRLYKGKLGSHFVDQTQKPPKSVDSFTGSNAGEDRVKWSEQEYGRLNGKYTMLVAFIKDQDGKNESVNSVNRAGGLLRYRKFMEGQYNGGVYLVEDMEQFGNAKDLALENGNGLLIPANRASVYASHGIRDRFKYDFGFGMKEYVVYDPRLDYTAMAHKGVTPQSSRLPRTRDDIGITLVDNFTDVAGGTFGGLFCPADAEGRAYGNMDRYYYVDSRHVTKNCENLLTDRGRPYAIAGKGSLGYLYKEDGTINWDIIDFKGYKGEALAGLRQDVEEFLGRISRSSSPSDYLDSDAGGGQVVAMVTDGVYFAPVKLPNSAPRNCNSIKVEVNGSDMILGWSGRVGLGGDLNSRMKMALPGFAFKMEVMMAEDQTNRPYIAGEEHGGANESGIDLAVSFDTFDSRAGGKESVMLKNNLYWYVMRFARKMGYSFLYKLDDKGNPVLDEVLVNRLCSDANGNVDESAKASFLRGEWGTVWSGLADGTKVFFTGNTQLDAKRNRAIRIALSACRRHGIDPRDIMDPMRMYEESDERTYAQIDQHMVFGDFTDDMMLAFFSGMDERICARDLSDNCIDHKPVFNNLGRMYMQLPGKSGGMKHYCTVIVGPIKSLGDGSEQRIDGVDASYSWQEIYRRAMDVGYLPSELRKAVDYAEYLTGDPSFLADRSNQRIKKSAGRARALFPGLTDGEISKQLVKQYPHDSYAELEHKAAVLKSSRDITYVRDVLDANGIKIKHPWQEKILSDAYNRLMYALGDHGGFKWSHAMVEMAAQRREGFRRRSNGENSVRIRTLADSIDAITESIKRRGIPIEGSTLNDRHSLPRMTQTEIDWWWNGSSVIREKWGTKEKFMEEIKKASDESLAQVNEMTENLGRKRALLEAFEGDYLRWDDWDSAASPYVYGGSYMWDLANADDEMLNAIRGNRSFGEMVDVNQFREWCANGRNHLNDIKRALENTKQYENVDVDYQNGKVVVYMKTVDDKTLVRVLDNATKLSQIMAMLNPGVFIGNMADRSIHQSIMQGTIWLAHRLHMGPYAMVNEPPNQTYVRKAANNETLIRAYIAFRQAGLNGQELDFLANAGSPEQILAWDQDRRSKMSTYQKAVDRVYGFQSGGNKLIKQQIQNFINRFAMFAEEAGQDFWFEKDPKTKMTYLETAISTNPAKWFADILGARSGNTPSLTIALQAMNSAKTGDMAQRNALWMLFQNAVKDKPLPKFLVTTMVSRFPQYALNVSGRILNWVLPMSSINYVFTNMIAERAHAKAQGDKTYVDPHYEQAQIHRSLREAMLVDITKLGFTAVSAILVALSGGIEPPEDEDKWGNIDEWTIFGLRVGEAWWMEDILGLALPSAAFTKSMLLGKPRFDILMNGCSNVMYSNPILKATDVIGFLANPEEGIISDYKDDYERFKDSHGGGPSWMDWIATNFTNFGLNWASQFVLPSALKEWYVAAQPYEVSYRTIYEENEYGALTEEGAAGEAVMKTTYQDAMLRRLTRRNPVMGWLADLFINPNTGYLAGEMPRTRMLDDIQLAQAEQWSIKDLEPQEAEAKLFEIVALLQSYDDLAELRSTGFYLDSVTRSALSSLCWDTVNELDNWYNGLQADGYFDYYAWGDGDYAEGQKAVGEIKQYYNQCRDYWTDFYYDKVRSDILSEPIVEYNRYNTTYARDVNGEIYATGIRPQGILPFTEAPGTLSDPEGTAGWVGDWASISAVTGMPMDQRGLIPVSKPLEEWPSLEEWADENSKGGYSSLYELWHGSGQQIDTDGDGKPDTTAGALTGLPVFNGSTGGGKSSKSSGYTRSYGGGGGGYSRGGGGGYSRSSGYPTIYSRYSAPNLTAPRVMDRVNRQRSQFDYLRPAFETKGSREAYRREDI